MLRMLRNKFKAIAFAIVAIVFVGCNSNEDANTVFWGKTNSYDPFLWKKQVPDTLKQTLCFDFNDDAMNFMSSPLKLGVFKKDDDGHLRQVNTDEMQLFVNGKEVDNNVLCVNASEKEIEVGVVFNEQAENKLHYWYIKPIDAAGLDRINDQESYEEDDALMEIKLDKHHVMNPLVKGVIWLGFIIFGLLILWFVTFKPFFYPTFRMARISLQDPEPYACLQKIKGCRLCMLSASPKKQSMINKLFTGEIKYIVNELWTSPIILEPRNKDSVRMRMDKNVYSSDANILKMNTDYVVVNEQTKNKTNIKIS